MRVVRDIYLYSDSRVFPTICLYDAYFQTVDDNKTIFRFEDSLVKDYHYLIDFPFSFFLVQNHMKGKWTWETKDNIFTIKGEIKTPFVANICLADIRETDDTISPELRRQLDMSWCHRIWYCSKG